MVDGFRLRIEIAKNQYSIERLAATMKISPTGLTDKINGSTKFSPDEIKRICKILGIKNRDEIFK